jgi:hypothetical protein
LNTLAPRLSSPTVARLVSLVCGHNNADGSSAVPYRRLQDINDFFMKDLGLEGSPPMGVSRGQTAKYWLDYYNGELEIGYIIEALVRPVYFIDSSCDLAQTVTALNLVLALEGLRLSRAPGGYRLVGTADIALPEPADTDCLGGEYVRELSDKCEGKLSTGDLDGAITNARTMLEAVLLDLQDALLGTRDDFGGDLSKQFKSVAKELRIDDTRTDLDEHFKQVVRGLATIVHGLAPIRNKMSDGHARERKPAPHHARLVVNAAKTVAVFLVDSYRAQRERGLIPAGPSSDGVA